MERQVLLCFGGELLKFSNEHEPCSCSSDSLAKCLNFIIYNFGPCKNGGPRKQRNQGAGPKIYGIGATCAQSAQQIQIDTNSGPNRHKTAHIQIDTNSAAFGIQIDTDSPFCTILMSKQIQLTPINWYYPNTGLTGYQP